MKIELKRAYLLSMLLAFISLSALAQKEYMLVLLHKRADAEKISKEASDKLMAGHMANINRLAKEDKLKAAGPFEGGGGLFVLNTTSTDEANAWLSTDPGIQAKRWDVELLPYKPREGSVCLVSEPYEMIMYQFIRFNAVVTKETAETYPEIINKHNEFLKQLINGGNVVTEAIFGDHDGGVLVIKGDLDKSVIESDPGIQEGLINYTLKQLWIAKGSFCEK